MTRAAAGEELPENAVLGTGACLDALQKGQVATLYVVDAYEPPAGWACDACGVISEATEAPRTCPACGQSAIRRAALKSEIMRMAAQCGAQVEVVQHGGLLTRMGGVGCRLKDDQPSPIRERGTRQYVVIAAGLYLFWVLLSGHYTTLLLSLGAASVFVVVALFRRMDRVDKQVSWTRPSFGLVAYLLWLLWTAIKASADVARRVWSPAMPISPSWTRLDTEIRTPLKKTLYANSITLTPGTLTTSAHDDHLMVHSLAETNIEELRDGEMERRIRKLEL